MTNTDDPLTACLDARDCAFKALRLARQARLFSPGVYAALVDAETAITQAIQIQLELRQARMVAA